MADEGLPEDAVTPVRCPMCGRPALPRCRPFCSPRCRDQDLLNWLNGRYAVPAVEADEDEGPESDQGG